MSLLADGTAPSLQAGAAYVLGTAVSNNEKLAAVLVQDHPALLQQLLTVGVHMFMCTCMRGCCCRLRACCQLLRLLLTLQPATMHKVCQTLLNVCHIFAATFVTLALLAIHPNCH